MRTAVKSFVLKGIERIYPYLLRRSNVCFILKGIESEMANNFLQITAYWVSSSKELKVWGTHGVPLVHGGPSFILKGIERIVVQTP